MPFSVYASKEFEHTHENEMMDEIISILNRTYNDAENWCAIFLEPVLNGQNPDALLVKKDKIISIEMKKFRGNVKAILDVNSSWIIEGQNGQRHTTDRKPYQQVSKQREKVIEYFQTKSFLPNVSSSTLRKVFFNIVALPDDSKWTMIGRNPRNDMWFDIVNLRDIGNKVMMQTSSLGLHLNEEMIPLLANDLKAQRRELPRWPLKVMERSIGESILEIQQQPIDLQIVQKLKSDNRIELKRALVSIQELKLEQYIPNILPLHNHENGDIRFITLDILDTFDYEEQMKELLLERMRDPLPSVLTKASRMLKVICDDSMVPDLIEIVQQGSQFQAHNAISVLQEIDDNRIIDPLIDLITQYEQRFSNADDYQSFSVKDLIEVLGIVGDERAFPILAEIGNHENHDMKMTALQAIAEIGGESAGELLITAIADCEFPKVKNEIIQLLGLINTTSILDYLHSLLQYASSSDFYEERYFSSAVECLHTISDPNSYMLLWKAYQRHLKKERYVNTTSLNHIIQTLMKINHVKVETSLLSLIQSKDSIVQKYAAQHMMLVASERSIKRLLKYIRKGEINDDIIWYIINSIALAFEKIPNKEPYMASILTLLTEDNIDQNIITLNLLGGIHHQKSREVILRFIDHPNVRIRLSVVHAISGHNSYDSIEPLYHLLQDTDRDVRDNAFDELHHLVYRNIGFGSATKMNIMIPDQLMELFLKTDTNVFNIQKHNEINYRVFAFSIVAHFWGESEISTLARMLEFDQNWNYVDVHAALERIATQEALELKDSIKPNKHI